MKFLNKLFSFLSVIVIILIIVYALIYLPSFLGYNKVIIDSDLMEPTYTKYSIVYYYDSSSINKGEIVTFMKGNNITTGRVINSDYNEYTIIYDKNEKINRSEILGKNINIVIKYLGYFVLLVNSNLVACVSLSIGIICLNIAFSLMSKKGKQKKILVADE